MITRTALAGLTGVALALPLTLTAPAHAAHGGGGVRTSGACSASAHWHLKAKADDGRIEVEGEVDSNHVGQQWSWTFRHDGSVSSTGRTRTAGVSGSFEVGRRMANLAGTDHFVFRATHAGQVCRGTISF
jgi:hypothetical protein